MNDDEIQTAEASAEAPATETDYTAEMSQTFDRLAKLDEVAKVCSESDLTKYSDYDVGEEPTEPTEDPQQPIDGIRAPASLSPTMQQQWGATPREMQQWIAEREAQAQQKISEQGRELSELHRGAQASTPHMQYVERIAQQTGLTPDDTLQRWAAADEFLSRDPAGAIQYLAAAAGIDLGQFAGDPEQQQAREMQAQQMDQMRAERAQWQQQQQQQQRHLTAAINRFANSKPYWAQIEPVVIQQIAAMAAVDPGFVQGDPMGALQEAEKIALKVSGIEDKLPARQAEARKKADEAKRLASLNVRSSSSSPRTDFSSMEEEMRATYERLHGRH